MALTNTPGFRCPQCDVRHTWVVDECACGYRSEASLAWNEEARRRNRENLASGCLWGWWDVFWIDGLLEGVYAIASLTLTVFRGIVSIWP